MIIALVIVHPLPVEKSNFLSRCADAVRLSKALGTKLSPSGYRKRHFADYGLRFVVSWMVPIFMSEFLQFLSRQNPVIHTSPSPSITP